MTQTSGGQEEISGGPPKYIILQHQYYNLKMVRRNTIQPKSYKGGLLRVGVGLEKRVTKAFLPLW